MTDKKKICNNKNNIITSSQIIRQSQIPYAYKYAECKRKNADKILNDIRLNYVTKNPIYTDHWYPQPVILYTHTESVNPSVRVNAFEEQKPELKKQIYVEPNINHYSMDDAQIQYLESNPVCFLVCGKPGIGEEHVAKALADYWNCCYLDPLTVIQEEIKAQSRTGRFIEFNLRSGRSIGGDIVLKLIKRLVNSSSCRHRGFVITGFPIIPNELFDEEETLASESAVFAAEQIISSLLTTVTTKEPVFEEIGGEEEIQEETIKESLVPSTISVNELGSLVSDSSFVGKSQKFNLFSTLKNQITELLTVFKRPYLIIYLKCPINETIIRRERFRHDIDSEKLVDLATKIFMPKHTNETIHLKRLVKEVRDNARNVRDEVEHYEKYVQPILDKFILNHDQQYVITIDARLPLASINETIQLKLRTLPLQKVLTVEKFSDVVTDEIVEEQEEVSDKDDDGAEEKTRKIHYDFTDKTIAEVFRDFQNLCTVGPRYRWLLSHWGYNCPVALRHGRCVKGDIKNAVRFMNQIFFLENSYAICCFRRNPRPYLLPPNPESPGGIFIFGVKYCGADDVARCLAYVFDAEVVNVKLLCNDYKNSLVATKAQLYRTSEIERTLTEQYDTMLEKWNEQQEYIETERRQWLHHILTIYARYQMLENEIMKNAVFQDVMQDSSLMSSAESLTQSEKSVDTANLVELELMLKKEHVPTDTMYITETLENPTNLYKYFPERLIILPKPEKPQELDSTSLELVDQHVELFKTEYIKDIVLTDETILTEITNKIRSIESKKMKHRTKKGSWIIVNIDSDKIFIDLYNLGFVPNEVLYLYDEDLDNTFLARKYAQRKFAPYHLMKDFLNLNGFKNAAARCPETKYTPEIIEEFSYDILDDILKSDRFIFVDKRKEVSAAPIPPIETPKQVMISSTVEDETEAQGTYRYDLLNNITKFENAWDEINMFLSDKNVEPDHISYAQDIEDLMLDAIRVVKSKFRMVAVDFDDNERDFEAQELRSDMDEAAADEEEAFDEEGMDNGDMSKRRLGDTHQYCPIALLKHNVLWKGKNLFGAVYENKLYFFSNEIIKDNFIANPTQVLPLKEPKNNLPPLRICIVGPISSGKKTIGRMLAKQLGLIYVNYIDMVNKYCLPRFVKVGRKNKDIYETVNTELEEYAPSSQEQTIFNTISAYFDEHQPLPVKYLNRILRRLWANEPYCACGIVLNGFPYCDSDFEYMTNHFLIPDMIISLKIKGSTAIQRSLDTLIRKWKIIKRGIQLEKNMKEEEILKQWEINRYKLFKELYNQKVEERLQKQSEKGDDSNDNFKPSLQESENTITTSVEQTLTGIKQFEEEDKAATWIEVNNELPEPVFEDNLETLEDAEQRLLQFIEDAYAAETNLIQPFERLCAANSIPFLAVNANRATDNILIELLMKLDSMKTRNESFLESTFTISIKDAEKLLNIGYYFLSNYGYSCPVQFYQNYIPIQQFLPKLTTEKILPIIHRQYIYFLNGEENLKQFQENPLKYTQVIKNYPLVAFRIAIIGPPKCGKTTLANRYCTEFGYKVVSRGEAVRYVLTILPHTLLACEIDKQLRKGKVLDYDLVSKAVEIYCSDGMALSQGIVFDGFPTCPEEMAGLFNVGLVPHLIYNLKSTFKFSSICLSTDNHARGIIPLYSSEFLKYRYCKWNAIESMLLNWIDLNFQNIYPIQCNFTKWAIWKEASKSTFKFFKHIIYYIQNFNGFETWRLQHLSVAPHEMKLRLSRYKNYCMCCWTRDKILHKSIMPINREKLLQFRSKYYYICTFHLDMFLNSPLPCAPETEDDNLPQHLPIEIRRVPVPDERFEYLCNFYKPASKVPAFLTVVDIAGLVKGASEGQGLGNAFLSEISACDAIFHLCRAFENEDVIHVEGDVNPVRDLEIIADELRLKDIEKLNKELEKLEKTYIRGNDKKLKPEYDCLLKVKTVLVDEEAQIRFSDWNATEIEVLNKHLFLTSKPGIYLINLSEKDYIKKKNKWLIKIKEWVDKNDPGSILIPFSGALEFKLADMPDDERKAYLEENKTTSALDKIIITGYKALQLEYFFTCGADEVKAWTIQKGTKAPGAAGRIHTHFEKGFIMAEVMKYNDFKQEGSETAVKSAGKYRQQGRNYVVEDGDIIYFKANTGAGLTKEAKKK